MHAFFPRTNGWDALHRALKGTIDSELMEQLESFESLPLKPGDERIGGEFGARSFASGYPDTQDIFLERAWHLDAEGRFVSSSPASKGMLVARSDVEVIEFLKATQAELKGNGQST